MAIGSAAAGALAQTTSLPTVFWTSAAILALTAAFDGPAIAAARDTAGEQS